MPTPANATLQRLRWLAPAAVLALAAVLRFWALSRPDSLVFDELYYVRDAVSQLANGFPTTWPDDDPAFGGERSRLFSDQASTIAHPPLGKWLIGLGILMFGADSGWGWRSAVAFFGVATVAVTMLLGWQMTRSLWVASAAGLLLAVDGVHVVLTRVALLDGFLAFFVALGALFVWLDLRHGPPGRGGPGGLGAILWHRPWALAAGATFGAAAAVKWSGLYPLVFFGLLVVAVDVSRRVRLGVRRPIVGGALQALVSFALVVPVAMLAYVASWAGWIATTGGQAREPGAPWWVSLWRWHVEAWEWHSTLSAPHPYQANPLTWPLALRPTAMYEVSWPAGADCEWASGCAAAISPLPNALVTWGGVAALLVLAWAVGRGLWRSGTMLSQGLRRAPARALPGSQGTIGRAGSAASADSSSLALLVSAFVLAGYLSGWLPWVLTLSRSAVFQFYAVVLTPFAALALALVLGSLAQRPGKPPAWSIAGIAGLRLDPSPDAVQGRRIAVGIFLAASVVLAVLFFPVWAGTPVAEWFWRAHLWLPGWR